MLSHLFYLFVFLLPWQTCFIAREIFLGGAKWEYGTVCFYLSDIALLFLLGTFLFSQTKFFSFQNFSLKFPKITKFSIIPLFVLWSSFSILWAPDKYLAFYSLVKLASALALLVVVPKIKFSWKKVIIILLLSALLQAGLGISQFLNQWAPANKYLGLSLHDPQVLGVSVVQTQLRRYLRAYGGMPHPNILGGYLALVLLLGIFLYLKNGYSQNKKELLQNILLLLVLVVVWVGLLLSFSRAAWLVFGLGFLFLFFSDKRKKDNALIWLKLGSILGVVFLFSFLFLPHLFRERFTLNNRLEIQSIEERIDYTEQAKNLIKNNFVKGVGIGNYTLANYYFLNKKLPAWYFQPVHNVFLLVWAELGIVGLVLFVLTLFVVVKPLLKKRIGWLALLLVLLMFFDHWLWTSHFGILFLFLYLGILGRAPILSK